MPVRQGKVISISGKGGAGKTTVAAIILKVLIERNPTQSILVVDADPATNLPDVLGYPVKKTVGMMATDLKKKIADGSLPPDISKSDILEAKVMETLLETPRFDLLAMGRTEGEGCYCFVNNVLTNVVDTLSKNYDLTLMDMEAGLEHLSRRTDRDVDIMLVVTDPSKMGLQTVARIRDLAREVHIKFGRIYLIGNLFPAEAEEALRDRAKEIGLELAGVVPPDPEVSRRNTIGQSLLDLPGASPAVTAVRAIATKIGLA